MFVLITGGGTGIGYGIAEVFAKDGAKVALLARRAEVLRRAAEALGPNAIWRACDVTVREQVVEAVDSVVDAFGALDVLVNNAAIFHEISTQVPLEEAERRWDEEMAVNLKGSFLMSLAAAPHLRQPGGRIINISSVNAYSGGTNPGALGYSTAKAGLHGLTYSLARELGPKGITVNAIVPNATPGTEMTGEWPQSRMARIANDTPVGRVGRVEDVAAAARFLASSEASYITGELLNVSGGRFFGR